MVSLWPDLGEIKMERINIKSQNFIELQEQLKEMGEKPFRAKQIYTWIHQKLANNFDEMTNISDILKNKLKEKYDLYTLEPIETLTSDIDGTKKYLFQLQDGNVIESVFMKYKHGNSVCISTQVGCKMGCKFCASTIGGLTRNLYASEMLDQVYRIQYLTDERVSNVVLMGTGEPLDNYEQVKKFVEMLSDENGLHISQRNITISTCGIVPKIRKLADEGLQITLAISLHSSDNEKRKELMPIANKYSIEEIMDACKYYFNKTKRRLTFEYSLIMGENDSISEARKLADLLKGLNCHVNLIPVNPIEERSYRQTKKNEIEDFKGYLVNHGINATQRREMGRDIQGACGQLRKNHINITKR